MIPQPIIPLLVVSIAIGVLAAIKFDDQSSLQADEIDDVAS